MTAYQQSGQRNEAEWKADREQHEQNEAESSHDELQKVNHILEIDSELLELLNQNNLDIFLQRQLNLIGLCPMF